jgi:hypothetical protein
MAADGPPVVDIGHISGFGHSVNELKTGGLSDGPVIA